MTPLHHSLIFVKSQEPAVVQAAVTVIQHLEHLKHPFALTVASAHALGGAYSDRVDSNIAPKSYDHMIVIGGDGTLLSAAKYAIQHQLPIIGINSGTVGFLADVCPTDLRILTTILSGDYFTETRHLLKVTLSDETTASALNDIVLSRQAARLLCYELFINDSFVCAQRADGLIISTPTGSTAYALSAGGSIIHPAIKAIALTPLCPHRLSSRPIIVPSDSIIDIHLTSPTAQHDALVSCDGFDMTTAPIHQATIQHAPEALQLIHPPHYCYFEALKHKLRWERSLTSS